MWEKSPKTYKKCYLDGYKRGTNRGQALGKEIAESLENEEETGILEKDIVIMQIPTYEIRDKEILITLQGKVEVPILIKPDSTKGDYRAFYEYKSGLITTPWTQKRVDKDDQMLFYSTGLYKKTGFIPDGELIWMETEYKIDVDGIERPHLTGKIHRFKYKAKLLDILKMQSRMCIAWRQIGKMMEQELI